MSISDLPISCYNDEVQKEEKFVFDLITKAIEKGLTQVDFNGIKLTSFTEQALIKKGSCVETSVNRRTIFPVLNTVILWKFPEQSNTNEPEKNSDIENK